MKKKCRDCGKIKEIDCFYKHKNMKDGRLNKCKECVRFKVNKNRNNNIDYYREYDRNRSSLPHRVKARIDYLKTEKGKESRLRTVRKYRKNNPEKYNAHMALGNAVRDGVLIKPDKCEKCLSKVNIIHGHHHDYSKPLDIDWLCDSCHKKVHADLN